MAAKIVPLETRPVQCNKDSVRVLEEALEEARAGRLTSVAVVWTTPSGATTNAYSRTETFQTLLGGLELLKHRMITSD